MAHPPKYHPQIKFFSRAHDLHPSNIEFNEAHNWSPYHSYRYLCNSCYDGVLMVIKLRTANTRRMKYIVDQNSNKSNITHRTWNNRNFCAVGIGFIGWGVWEMAGLQSQNSPNQKRINIVSVFALREELVSQMCTCLLYHTWKLCSHFCEGVNHFVV